MPLVSLSQPNQAAVFFAVNAFLAACLPGVAFRQGQINRVAEPKASNFIVGWLTLAPRLATNWNEYSDCAFIGEIKGTELSIYEYLVGGPIAPGAFVFGPGVAEGTRILPVSTGTNNSAALPESQANAFAPNQPYQPVKADVTIAQTVLRSKLASGLQGVTEISELSVQLDIHGPDCYAHAQTVATLIRDEYGVDVFAAANPAVSPLFCDDPLEIPFINGERQFEKRFVVNIHLQVNQSLLLSQQFADQVKLTLTDASTASN